MKNISLKSEDVNIEVQIYGLIFLHCSQRGLVDTKQLLGTLPQTPYFRALGGKSITNAGSVSRGLDLDQVIFPSAREAFVIATLATEQSSLVTIRY